MSVEDRGGVQHETVRWPRHPQLAGDEPESIALYAYLLDSDGELAEEFDVRARIAARQLATARVLQVAVGACDLAPWFEVARQGLGLLILDGLLALEIRVGGRTSAELVGPGDLLQPLGPPADRSARQRRVAGGHCGRPGSRCSTASSPSACGRSPRSSASSLRRACRRPLELDAAARDHLASPGSRSGWSCCCGTWPRAGGASRPTGVRLSLPLTHRLLGQLVAAERPSISHALKRLAQAGLVTGATDDLHLHDSLEHQLRALTERDPGLAERTAAHQRRTRRPIA